MQFGTETWCYVRRGPYAAFVVAGPAARPVLLIDRMDRLLLSAEETRVNRPAAGDQPVVPAAQSSRRRTPLHPDRPAGEPVVNGARGEGAVAAAVRAASAGEGTERPTEALGSIARERRIQPTGPAGNRPVPRPRGGAPARTTRAVGRGTVQLDAGLWDLSDDRSDVDRFSLAREFGGLLQDPDEGADG